MYSTGVGTYRIIRLLPKLKENAAEVEVPPLEGVAQHTALSRALVEEALQQDEGLEVLSRLQLRLLSDWVGKDRSHSGVEA